LLVVEEEDNVTLVVALEQVVIENLRQYQLLLKVIQLQSELVELLSQILLDHLVRLYLILLQVVALEVIKIILVHKLVHKQVDLVEVAQAEQV